jgi:transposase
MIYYAAIDLHCNQCTLVMIDDEDRQVMRERLPNNLEMILYQLSPYAGQLYGLAVESTFNWYWLVDGLNEAGYRVELVQTSQVKKYEGLKEQNDWTEALWLAHLLRLGILPTGYIYPRETRGLRDILRKRLRLVSQRTAHILSLEGLYNRCCGRQISAREVRHLPEGAFGDPDWDLMASTSQRLLTGLDAEIRRLEKRADEALASHGYYRILQTIPGVGKILGATISLETGDIKRFKRVGNYASYCRCVESKKTSNQKKKGEGNRKNGNSYLGLAWMEAAQGALVWQEKARRFYQRKKARKSVWVARKALAHKLCRAGYFMMRDQREYCSSLLFG